MEYAVNAYSYYSNDGQAIFHFLNSIGIIKENRDLSSIFDIVSTLPLDDFQKIVINKIILENLLQSNGEYGIEANSFLEKFKKTNDLFTFAPGTKERTESSNIRNLLFDLEVIDLLLDGKTYSLRTDLILELDTKENLNLISPELLSIITNIKEEYGYQAELAAIEFEKKRLSFRSDLLKRIDHVSRKYVNAGYDILSCELEGNIERYIEVKSVSNKDMKFYWSRNEVETSKRYLNQYFIYLVRRNSIKDIPERITIIQNPYTSLLNSREWEKTIENYSFIRGSK